MTLVASRCSKAPSSPFCSRAAIRSGSSPVWSIVILSRLGLSPRWSSAIRADVCDDPPKRAVPSLLSLRSTPFFMLGWVTSVKGDVLLMPRNIPIFSPPAIKLKSEAGAAAATWISPAASIWVASVPPLTKINWTSSPYLSKIFLSLATHNGVLCGVAVETATLICGLVVCASEYRAVTRDKRRERTMIGFDFISILSSIQTNVSLCC